MNQENSKIIIKVKDRNGDFNNWIICGETDSTYKIQAECDRGYISEVYKCTADYIDGVLYSCGI
jgi:hypothetical protein